jgi:hypothetical protein
MMGAEFHAYDLLWNGFAKIPRTAWLQQVAQKSMSLLLRYNPLSV